MPYLPEKLELIGLSTFCGSCWIYVPLPRRLTGLSSAQLVLGQPLVLPGELKDMVEASAEDFSS